MLGSKKQVHSALVLAACGLWLLGFELLPTAHLALHEHLHEHQHGVAHEQTPHDGAGDLPHQAHEHERPGEPQDPSEHGDGSLAHRDLAAHGSAASLPPVRQALLTWTETWPRDFDEDPSRVSLRARRARSPPAILAL